MNDVYPFPTNRISSNFLNPSSPFFGHYDQFFPSNSRGIQVVARLVF